jgi:hypothetical protein
MIAGVYAIFALQGRRARQRDEALESQITDMEPVAAH